jgi:glucosyl-3-phosphoglycerate phosphatase
MGPTFLLGESAEVGRQLKRLLLLRHGDAATPLLHYPNHNNMPLSPLGIEQARSAALALKGAGIERIVASPFRRAMETAEAVAEVTGLPLEVDPRLRERTNESLYGISYKDIELRYGQATRIALESGRSHLVQIGGFEQSHDCIKRIESYIKDELENPQRVTLVVAHGGTHEWFLAVLLGLRPSKRWFGLGKCRISIFDICIAKAKLERIVGLNMSAGDHNLEI